MDVQPRPQHRRNASSKTGIFRSLVSPKSRPASPEPSPANAQCDARMKPLPTDQSHTSSRGGLRERAGNVQSPPSSPSKKGRSNEDNPKAVTIPTTSKDGKDAPKKSKSSTNLAAVFAKMNRSSKDLSKQVPTDKENTTPPVSATPAPETPIWAQFSSQPNSNSSRPDSRRRPDSRGKGNRSPKNVKDEIAKYTPKEYSPSKQRNFNGTLDQPELRPTLSRDRPHSTYLPTSDSFMNVISRKISGRSSTDEKRRSQAISEKDMPILPGRVSMEQSRLLGRDTHRKASGSSTEQAPAKEKLDINKRGGRVAALAAAFSAKTKDPHAETQKAEAPLDPKAVDAAFEAVLDARNIPEPMRQKMRTLTLRVKTDFIKQDEGSKGSTPPGTLTGDLEKSKSSAVITEAPAEKKEEDDGKSTKRSRTRSRTFTFSRGDKKNKSESPSKRARAQSKSRPMSIDIPKDTPIVGQHTGPTTPTGSCGFRSGAPALPVDYISYLHKNTDPTKIEVGRLHKLRILLRNETVAWVDSFISQGGMAEIVALLHRTMEVEWREDHEDQLLHETLLCLKGLCTTERALAELNKVADDLFPALLAMLFDEEKKGPAEYTTRTVIINVLFNYLSAATAGGSPADLETRARRILAFLGEQQKPEEARPVDFVLGMRIPRPYKLWCREVSNVTKEVFWIFLHHLNVVPLPKPSSSHSNVNANDEDRAKALQATYTQRHFPGSRPPVPAAPYIGGVEWDATTYLTAHLDLLNGLIASLPTTEARYTLREELQASGFEKVMGAVMRTCKEKFYSGVHDGLRAWVAAAAEDGCDTRFVREGPTDEEVKEHAMKASPKKSPKKKQEKPPQLDAPLLEAPKLDLGLKLSKTNSKDDEGWLG
ncbi:GTPase-binding protein rid1 [Fulvia fulva]|uniref:GTPase-binding protein rid1 n=1 Tax=Passalora fulva TaxID=5499 RepID=A0A9Q8P9R1_PASFU|nr:GTPase-binding protein rid1 [Fulvia fulva]KAK4624684.1 GTPase-binding protein rid1 [Fulvia fulva]KAK4625684.1 GTPase-binding protein rid1 [Fulvia fulva]UJO18196.1 GTPase-binding protein rid1 [Fulvia fulva]WPV14900.1 GTPase-binding protein rid1 [Fulvia fulva]WPV29567.1 GTPase-binding protein rid1 [Fulvia fulva]